MSFEDAWAVCGSRPGSSASMVTDSPDYHEFSKTYTKPKSSKKPSSPWSNRYNTSSGRSTTPTSYRGQNYFMNKDKANIKQNYTDDSLFKNHTTNENWEAPWHEKTNNKQHVNSGKEKRPNSPSPSVNSIKTKPRNYYGKKWNKQNPSYADESLFGADPIEASFKAPWDKEEKRQYVFDATDYKALEIKKQLQNNAKNSKKKAKAKKPVCPETVDKVERALQSQLSVYGEQSRPQSRLDETPNKRNKPKFKDSYVDESLFGPKLQEASFPAPWEKGRTTPIHHFDGTNSSVIIQDDGREVHSRPGSRAGSRAGSRRGSVETLRAPWK